MSYALDHNSTILEKTMPNKATLGSIITLKDVSLNIKHGEFVCIIGDVASGKTSLLSSIIGDLLTLND